MASERQTVAGTFDGKADVYEPTNEEGEYSDGAVFPSVPTLSQLPCTMNFIGADERLEGVVREHYELARAWFAPDVEISSIAQVRLAGYRWEVVQGTAAHTGQQTQAMIIIGRNLVQTPVAP